MSSSIPRSTSAGSLSKAHPSLRRNTSFTEGREGISARRPQLPSFKSMVSISEDEESDFGSRSFTSVSSGSNDENSLLSPKAHALPPELKEKIKKFVHDYLSPFMNGKAPDEKRTPMMTLLELELKRSDYAIEDAAYEEYILTAINGFYERMDLVVLILSSAPEAKVLVDNLNMNLPKDFPKRRQSQATIALSIQQLFGVVNSQRRRQSDDKLRFSAQEEEFVAAYHKTVISELKRNNRLFSSDLPKYDQVKAIEMLKKQNPAFANLAKETKSFKELVDLAAQFNIV